MKPGNRFTPGMAGGNSNPRPWRALAIFAVVTAILCGVFIDLQWTLYRQTLNQAQRNASNLAVTLAQRLEATLVRVDQELTDLAALVDPRSLAVGNGHHMDTAVRLLEARGTHAPEIFAFQVLDQAGRPVYSSSPDKPLLAAAGERADFIQLRESTAPTLVFSEVLTLPGSDRMVLPLGRAMRDRDGRFVGAVYALIDIERYQALFAALDLGREGAVGVRRLDGSLVMRRPLERAMVNQKVSHIMQDLVEAGQLSGSGDFRSPVDKVERIYAFQALTNYPLYTLAGFSRSEVLSDWKAQATLTAAVGLAALGVIGALLTGLLLARASQAREHKRLQHILHTASDGLHIIDDNGNVIEASDAFCRMLDYPRQEVIGMNIARWEANFLGDEAMQTVRHLIAREGTEIFETRHRRRDGSLIDVELTTAAVDIDGQKMLFASSRDITERKAAAAAVLESERRASTIFRTSPDIMAISDKASGRFVAVNDAFVRSMGWSAAEVIGRTSGELDTWGVKGERQRLFNALGNASRLNGFQSLFRRRNGEVFPVVLSVEIARLGEADCLILSAHDITEQQRNAEELDRHRNHLEEMLAERTADLVAANAELARAKEAAESGSRAKSTFLANMSHELRTPLNAITGLANLIRRDGLPAPQMDRLEKIDAAGRHLLQVINDILDLSRIEADRLILEQAPVSVINLMEQVVALVAEDASRKGLALDWHVPPTLPTHLVGDITRLRQALLNYASNAMKFTRHGSVSLRACLLDESADSVLVRFEVEDTGIGIDASVLNRLFSSFSQADATTTREYGGTGLGLAITRRLAGLMGGDAGAESVPGRGSTFWFTARLQRGGPTDSVETTGARTAEESLRRDFAGRRILLAEDEPINREIAVELLEEVGLAVDVAADGLEAVEKCVRENYDLVLMDMQMPRLDGLEATRRIRAAAMMPSLPIIAVTANAFAEDRQQCLEAGMSDFMSKPFEPHTLFAMILKWMPRSGPASTE